MDLTHLRKIESLSNNLNRIMLASHRKAFAVHQAPGKLYDSIEALFELGKLEAVIEYIESQSEDKRDKSTLSSLKGRSDHYRRKLDDINTLEKELIQTAINLQIEQEAKNAGAINPEIVGTYLENSHEITHQIDSDGNVAAFFDGRSIKDAVRIMKSLPETSHLFGDSPSGSTVTTTRNPWKAESFNLTEQGRIFKDSPAMAAKLKAEAEKASTPKGANPWKAETLNLSLQGQIFKENPSLAKRMILDAGRDPGQYNL